MGTVALVSNDVTWWGNLYIEDMLTGLGHTTTQFDELAVDATNLNTFDLIINTALFDVDTSVMAAFYETYMATDGIPI